MGTTINSISKYIQNNILVLKDNKILISNNLKEWKIIYATSEFTISKLFVKNDEIYVFTNFEDDFYDSIYCLKENNINEIVPKIENEYIASFCITDNDIYYLSKNYATVSGGCNYSFFKEKTEKKWKNLSLDYYSYSYKANFVSKGKQLFVIVTDFDEFYVKKIFQLRENIFEELNLPVDHTITRAEINDKGQLFALDASKLYILNEDINKLDEVFEYDNKGNAIYTMKIFGNNC